MKNGYFDSPYTIQRLKHEPDVVVYHYDIECPRYYSTNSYSIRKNRDNSQREAERINAAVEAALEKQSQTTAMQAALSAQSAKAMPVRKSAKRCPHGYPIRDN